METINHENNDLENSLKESQAVIEANKEAPKKRGRKKKELIVEPPKPELNMKETELAISHVVGFSGTLLSQMTKFKGFEFDDEELAIIGKQGAECAKYVIPVINPMYMAIGALSLTLLSSYGLKYYAYKLHLEELKKEKKDK